MPQDAAALRSTLSLAPVIPAVAPGAISVVAAPLWRPAVQLRSPVTFKPPAPNSSPPD